MGEKMQGSSGIISRHKIDGESKKMVQEREFKELLCTAHGHELRWGNARGLGGQGGGGVKEENWGKNAENFASQNYTG